MSDYYWLQTVTADRMSMIEQVWYYVVEIEQEDGTTSGDFVAVKYWNLNERKRYFRTNVPASYSQHLKEFLWREQTLMRIHSRIVGNKDEKAFSKFIEKQIALMDEVVEQLLVPCMLEGGELLKDFRSPGFDEYLATEWHVGRHDPDSVNDFRDGSDVVLETCDVTKL
ncbi:hypothetical protein HYDPIDRAFT_35103, partial [Hydnomerulius pinastri MD-312]